MRRVVAALVIALSFGFMVVPSAAADSGGLVVTSATVGGQDVASTNLGAPLRLVPGEFVDVELRVANNLWATRDTRFDSCCTVSTPGICVSETDGVSSALNNAGGRRKVSG